MKEKAGFIMYKSFYGPTKDLPAQDKADLFDAIFLYQEKKKIPELSPAANMAFGFMKETFIRDVEKYAKKCKKNSDNAKKGWENQRANACGRIQTHANDADIDKDIDKDKDLDKKKKTIKKKFSKPTISEIEKYCKERKNIIDPHVFYDYYESNGWKINKNSMKDWKATVRNWERRNEPQAKKTEEPEEFGGINA